MLKELVIGACLVLALVGCTTPSPTREPASTALVAPAPTAGCVADTATRIPVKEHDCAGFGRTYTQDDIQRTGQPTTAQALRLLDPSLTVHGH